MFSRSRRIYPVEALFLDQPYLFFMFLIFSIHTLTHLLVHKFVVFLCIHRLNEHHLMFKVFDFETFGESCENKDFRLL